MSFKVIDIPPTPHKCPDVNTNEWSYLKVVECTECGAWWEARYGSWWKLDWGDKLGKRIILFFTRLFRRTDN